MIIDQEMWHMTYTVFGFVVVMIHFWMWYLAKAKSVSGFLHVAVLLNCFGFASRICPHSQASPRFPVSSLQLGNQLMFRDVYMFPGIIILFFVYFNVIFPFLHKARRCWRNNVTPKWFFTPCWRDTRQSTREPSSSRRDCLMPELKWEVLHWTWDNNI